MQVIANACAEKKAELRVMERNVTALSSTNAALRSWLQEQEPRSAALPSEFTPSTAIVPADSLCEHALSAQVCTTCHVGLSMYRPPLLLFCCFA